MDIPLEPLDRLLVRPRRYGKRKSMFARIKAEAIAGGGVPRQAIAIVSMDETLIWEPTGEVRKLR